MLLFSVFCCLYSTLFRVSVIVLDCQLLLNVPGFRDVQPCFTFLSFSNFFSLIYLSVLQGCLSFFKGFVLSLCHVFYRRTVNFSQVHDFPVEASFLFPFNLLFDIITGFFFRVMAKNSGRISSK